MPGYTVRTPYRVDEPSLGFVEYELPDVDRIDIDPTGALLCLTDDPDTQAPNGLVRVFAYRAWTSWWWGPFRGEGAE